MFTIEAPIAAEHRILTLITLQRTAIRKITNRTSRSIAPTAALM